MPKTLSYGQAIRDGFQYLLSNYQEVFAFGQGLWSPWYVGNSMTDLEKEFGKDRVIDSPVSELAVTGAAIGASLQGYRPIVVHPRVDFMLYAADTIINQAAKWSYMFSGQAHPAVTIRAIVNRGGEQGAQHSQALHSLFAHIPGLRVVMPATVADARDLLIASVLCDDPVLYIDDRWLYEQQAEVDSPQELSLANLGPEIRREGQDITLVAASYSLALCLQAAEKLQHEGIQAEVIDLRVINPLNLSKITKSVQKTRRLYVVDGGWSNCGLAGEIIAGVCEELEPGVWRARPKRLTLPDIPAPTSPILEKSYYHTVDDIVTGVKEMIMAE